MVAISGANKLVIRSIQGIADLLNRLCDAVHICFRCDAGLFGLQFNLLAMLIGPRLEEYVVAVLSLKSGNAVRQHDLIAVSDMGLARCVGDRRCNIIFPLVHFVVLPVCSSIIYIFFFLKINHCVFLF